MAILLNLVKYMGSMWALSEQLVIWAPHGTTSSFHQYRIDVGSIRAISNMGPMWDPHVHSNNTHGINVGLIRAISYMGPRWDPHVRSTNAYNYGINVGSIMAISDMGHMGPIYDPRVRSNNTHGIKVDSIREINDMGPYRAHMFVPTIRMGSMWV